MPNLALNRIRVRADVDSPPLNENFIDLENESNDQNRRIGILEADNPSNPVEVQDARDLHTVLRDRLRSGFQLLKRNVLIEGGEVTINASPDQVDVSAGEAIIDGVGVKWLAGTSDPVSPAPSGKHRIDVVVANMDGSLSILSGGDFNELTEDPIFPVIPVTMLSLAALYVSDALTVDLTGEIFVLKEDDPYYPNIFRTVPFDLTENVNVNNLIIRNIAFGCGSFYIFSQGFVHLKDASSQGADGVGEFITDGQSWKSTSTDWTLQNAGGDVLEGSVSGGTAGKGDPAINVYQGNPGANGKNISIKALRIYIDGGLASKGGDGSNGVTENDASDYNNGGPSNVFLAGEAFIGAGAGNGGNGGDIYLEAVEEIYQNGDIESSGGDAGLAGDASSGSIGNLGGKGADGGNSGNVTLKCRDLVTTDMIITNSGNFSSGGTGSGGSDNNGNGSNGTGGASGTTISTEWDFDNMLPALYADWFRRLI